MTVASPTHRDLFLAYLEPVLSLHLQPGQVVVLDNQSVHQHAAVRQRIDQAGTASLYLPPASNVSLEVDQVPLPAALRWC